MSLGTVIDIVIGLFFTYLILSLIVSEIQEQLAALFEFRAKHLKKSIKILLGEDEGNSEKPGEKSLTDFLYQNSAITDLNQYATRPFDKYLFKLRMIIPTEKIQKIKSVGPSYIPPETFATALLGVILETSPEKERQNLIDNLKANSVASLQSLKKQIDELDELTFLPGTKKRLKRVVEDLELRLAIQQLATNNSQQTKIKNVSDAVINWYEQAMQRSTGVYKRNVKGFTLLVGFIIAVLVNVNTFNIIDALSKDASLRANLIESYGTFLGNAAVTQCLQENSTTTQNLDDIKKCSQEIQNYLKTTKDNFSSLPIGWHISKENKAIFAQFKQELGKQGGFGFLGWFITAIAISMGAPFWFDVLNKFINVRNTGTPSLNTDKKTQPSSTTQE